MLFENFGFVQAERDEPKYFLGRVIDNGKDEEDSWRLMSLLPILPPS